MKILCVHQGFELYGSDRTFIQSVTAIKHRYPGAELTVLLPKEGALFDALREQVDDVQISELYVLRKAGLFRAAGLALFSLPHRILAARTLVSQHDLTYINSIVVIDFLLATTICRKPSILHVHELLTGIPKHIFSALFSLSNARLVFNSRATQRSYSGRRSRQAAVIENGVAAPPISSSNLPFNEKFLNFLLIGRINSWKGQRLFVEAMRLLPGELRVLVRLKIVGGVFDQQDHFERELRADIRAAKLGDQIELVPFTPDPSKYYRWSDVVVVPSIKPEPFGLVAIEAMAHSRAVIAADHGGLSDIVVHSRTGLLVPPRSAALLAEAIKSYVENRELVRKHGMRGYARYLEKYREKVYMEAIAQFVTIASAETTNPCGG